MRGLVPPVTFTIDQQVERAYINFHRAGRGYGEQEDVVSKYLYMIALQDRNETLFYKMITQYIAEVCEDSIHSLTPIRTRRTLSLTI